MNQIWQSALVVSTLLSTAVLAEDALVLPKNVGRFYLVTSQATATTEFNDDGKRVRVYNEKIKDIEELAYALSGNTLNVKADIEADILREDFAAEYGLTEKLTLSLQLPMILKADIKINKNSAAKTFIANNQNAAGDTLQALVVKSAGRDGKKAGSFGDLLLGGKYQWFNSDKTSDQSESQAFRAAVGLGIKLPTGSIAGADTPDYSTTTACQTKSYILGVRTYWDLQPVSWYVLNLYTENEYRFSGDRNVVDTNLTTFKYKTVTTKFKPGIFTKASLDSGFEPKIGDHTTINPGVQLHFTHTGKGEYTDKKGVTSLEVMPRSYDLYAAPYASVFYTGFKMPFKVQYTYYKPLSGRNSEIASGASYELQGYFKF